MRYNVLTSRTFHNRIAKSTGVLVAVALVAALGLPSAAQAQSPAVPTVDFDDTTLMIQATWTGNLGAATDADNWLLEYIAPGLKTQQLDPQTGLGTDMPVALANDPRIHHGIWQVRVSYYQLDSDTEMEGDQGKVIGTPSAWAAYLHGPPDAPTGFDSFGTGTTRTFVWDTMKGVEYWFRYTDGDPDSPMTEWKGWTLATSPRTVENLDPGETYTFELNATGQSDATGGTPKPSDAVVITVEMGTPTPTLPEIALLLLVMLLLGSGAYLLRGRQSGGLTHA